MAAVAADVAVAIVEIAATAVIAATAGKFHPLQWAASPRRSRFLLPFFLLML
jgi:hypothetical protein